jgi:hypothetical protein
MIMLQKTTQLSDSVSVGKMKLEFHPETSQYMAHVSIMWLNNLHLLDLPFGS